MHARYLLAFLFVFIANGTFAKKNRGNVKLIEAYTQRSLPGIPGSRPTTNTYFIVVWENNKTPESFFWRGEGGWVTCSMARAHKMTGHNRNIPAGIDYMTEKILPTQVRKGDTLRLVMIPGGKFPIPSEIPDTAKNALFYKTSGSGWLSLPVKNIGRKQDIANP
jgi:hypothetical protein